MPVAPNPAFTALAGSHATGALTLGKKSQTSTPSLFIHRARCADKVLVK